MAYTYVDLKTKLQTQIGDPNLDDSVAGDALNYTQQAIFDTFDLTLNSDTQVNAVAAAANVLTTPLPINLQRITALYITSPAAYAADITNYFMKIKDFRASYPDAGTNTSGLRDWSFWTSVVFGNKANTNFVVNVDYIKYVPTLTASSDVPTIPQAFEEMLMLGAKIRIYEQKEDFDYAQQFTNRYADLVEAFTTRYSTRQVDAQIVISGSRSRVSGR